MTVVPRLYFEETLQRKMQVIASGGGGYPWDLLPGTLNTDPISDQNVILHTRFRTWPLKSISVFRPGGDHKTQHYMFT